MTLLSLGWALAATPALAQPSPEPASAPPTDAVPPAAAEGAPFADEPPEVSFPEAAPSPAVRIIYTGAAKGIGRHFPPVELLQRLDRRATISGAQVQTVKVEHGVLAQREALLRTDGTMAGMVAFLDGEPITCGAPSTVVGALTPRDRLLLDVAKPPAWLSGIRGQTTFLRQTCTHPSGSSATLTRPSDSELPDWGLTAWETREALAGTIAVAGHTMPFLAVSEPPQEHSRTVHRITELRATDPTAIYVDAGAHLDGVSSVRDGQPSLHRATGLRDLARVDPSVLVPGATELVIGGRAFIEEQAPHDLPYIATNWAAEDPLLELPPSLTVEVPHPDGPLRVAFIGILDPAIQRSNAGLAAEGITITDPIAAVQPVVTALEESESPPHAIVALTTASGDVQERIRRELRGVDLLIGDPSLATYRTERRDVELRPLDSDTKGAAVTLPMDGLATADLTFDAASRQLRHVGTEPVPVAAVDPVDPTSTAAVTTVRADVYPALESPLVGPAVPGTPLATWDTERWHQLVCEAVRTGSDADIAVLAPLPPPPSTPGPLTELQALASLAVLDTLEVHRIPGTQLQRLADRLDGFATVTCGIPVGQRVSKVGPRWLEPDRTYRVVTSHQAAATTAIGEVLSSLESTSVLDQPTVRPVPSLEDPTKPATLRSVALHRLREVRDTPPEGGVAGPDHVAQAMLVDGPMAWDPLFLLRVRRVGVQSQSFQGVDDPAFAEVPETLATSPSSYTLGSTADLAFEYTGPALWSDLRAIGAFSRIRAGEEDPEELADDLLLSTSHSLPGLSFPVVTPVRLMPFGEVAYDTEFTAIEEEDGGTGIAQSDLSLTLGLSALRQGPIRALRFGGFVNRDMARRDEKPPEFGGRLDWETYQSFGPSVKWTTAAGVFVYADTADDDASDLRLRALGETRLLLPLATWLDLGVYGQAFALRGRTAVNDTLGVSTTWGVTLDMAGAFAL